MRILCPSWRGSKVVLAIFSIFIVYPLHGIELTDLEIKSNYTLRRHMHFPL